MLIKNLGDWFEEIEERAGYGTPTFDVPFELIDLQKFDYALEGILFQQLIRMPSAVYASTSGAMEAAAFLAVEDFLHASVKGLWESFWNQEEPMPFYVTCLYNPNLRFYQAEKAIANGKLGGLCATAIMQNNSRHRRGKWADIVEIALLRPNADSIAVKDDTKPSLPLVGEALFFAFRILLARSLSQSNNHNSNSIFVLLIDSQYVSIVKIEGDMSKLDYDLDNVYGSASEWIKNYAKVAISPFDKIWNKLGNANWGDIGALQVLFATFHCITQYVGSSKHTIDDLAAEHSSRLHERRLEKQLVDTTPENGTGLFQFQHNPISTEIVEIQEDSIQLEPEKLKRLEVGSVVWLEDSNWQKGYQIEEVLSDGEIPYYIASPMEDPGNSIFLYVASNPSHLEHAWEDMKLWYQVQRQTKMLTIMRQKGLSSKYLPQLSASGKIVHPGQCQKMSSGGHCSYPWCGTPVLAITPVGRTVSDMLRSNEFGPNEAIRCFHDCLSALSVAASAGIRHGDIRPENIICIHLGSRQPYFVLIGWGHAVLEERDRPAMNLHFSSTYALQEGKLCSASDAESLVYLLFFACNGELPDLDSIEGALQWRETSWSKRLIQQRLGDISAVLKAFADYVDSLCGTPYPMDYDIWLRRLRRHINDEEHGKEIVLSS